MNNEVISPQIGDVYALRSDYDVSKYMTWFERTLVKVVSVSDARSIGIRRKGDTRTVHVFPNVLRQLSPLEGLAETTVYWPVDPVTP